MTNTYPPLLTDTGSRIDYKGSALAGTKRFWQETEETGEPQYEPLDPNEPSLYKSAKRQARERTAEIETRIIDALNASEVPLSLKTLSLTVGMDPRRLFPRLHDLVFRGILDKRLRDYELKKVRVRGSMKASRFKGVSWHAPSDKWEVHLYVNGIDVNLGRFADEVEAAKTYDAAAIRYCGKYAKTNGLLEA